MLIPDLGEIVINCWLLYLTTEPYLREFSTRQAPLYLCQMQANRIAIAMPISNQGSLSSRLKD